MNTHNDDSFVPSVSHIVCFDSGFNIGVLDKTSKEFHMPWGRALKEDLRRFKETTEGHIVVMGSNTFSSIGRPLSNRINIIVSSNTYNEHDSDLVYVRETLEEALALADYLAHRDQINIFIIGGASIYSQTSHLISKAYITLVDTNYTHRPFKFKDYELIKYDIDFLEDFKMVSKELYREPLFMPKLYFTVWERNSTPKVE